MTGTLHEDVYTFMKISCGILLRMKKVSHKICRENQNTYFMFYIFFFFENRTVHEKMSKSMDEPERSQTTIWRRVPCKHTPARARAHTHTHTQNICNTYFCFKTIMVL
jgi:hypothetical protein